MQKKVMVVLLVFLALFVAGCETTGQAISSENCKDGIDNDGDGAIDCADSNCINKIAGTFPCAHNPAYNCVAYCRDVETVCWDGYDNDGDGAIDCADSSCEGKTILGRTCTNEFGVEDVCDDDFDNDGDGHVDSDDSDCGGTPLVEICDDTADNDNDGNADCADSDCSSHVTCQPEVCDNDFDDNADGIIDCDDVGCSDHVSCQVVLDEICDNGVDDDGDGDVDCDAADCSSHDSCQPDPEVCTDGIDNDGDGAADCADTECTSHASCQITPDEVCDNGIDDDTDGFLDCSDPDCNSHSSCIVLSDEICDNVMDDDGDSKIDCLDTDCSSHPVCTTGLEHVCSDKRDNDGDGVTDCLDINCNRKALATYPCPANFRLTCRSLCQYGTELDCKDGYDNDGDGVIDCADPDCDGRQGAALKAPDYTIKLCEYSNEVTCDDNLDNDGDGLVDCEDSSCSGRAGCPVLTSANGAPVLDTIGGKNVDEEEFLTFTVSGSDPDGDILSYSATNLPSGATFTAQTFRWTSQRGDAGEYRVTFSVSDGELSDEETVTINVGELPCLDADSDSVCDSVDVCSGHDDTLDADGDGTPDGCDSQTCGNNVVESGEECDGGDECTVQCTYKDSDDDNIRDALDNCPQHHNTDQSNFDGDSQGDACDTNDDNDDALDNVDCAQFDPVRWRMQSAYVDSDSDGFTDSPSPVDLCIGFALPQGYVTTSTLDNCPSTSNPQQGDYDNDGQGDVCDSDDDNDGTVDSSDCASKDSTKWQNLVGYIDADQDGVAENANGMTFCSGAGLQVGYTTSPGNDNCPSNANANQANSDGDSTGDVCDICPFDVQNDADSDGVCGNVDICPGFDDSSDGDGDGTPDGCDVCPLHNPNDPDGDGQCGVTVITNTAPILDTIGSKHTNEEVLLSFGISGSDSDGDELTFSALNVPSGATFAGQTFSWTPRAGQQGEYSITFSVSDGSLSDSEVVVIIVDEELCSDSDSDGVCDSIDVCAGHDDSVDTDGDGTPDGCDVCVGFSDALDSDGDGVPDGCDICPLDSTDDSDGDGVCDSADVCAGHNDGVDTDGDGAPDGCDVCPLDSPDDSDNDGFCDSNDMCAGFDDALDRDADRNPDGCDPCPDDNPNDSDDDGVCDSVDVCAGHDDSVDTDGDGTPDGCDVTVDTQVCIPSVSMEATCSDGNDNDCDGMIDCADNDCMYLGHCTLHQWANSCGGFTDGIDYGKYEAACGDGVDNDADGHIDCFDTDCAYSNDCPLSAASCNCPDLDGDGQIYKDDDDLALADGTNDFERVYTCTQIYDPYCSDPEVKDFIDWMREKNYAGRITAIHAENANDPDKRFPNGDQSDFQHYFNIRNDDSTGRGTLHPGPQSFKKDEGPLVVGFTEFIATDEGFVNEINTEANVVNFLEPYLEELLGREVTIEYKAEHINYAQAFGPATGCSGGVCFNNARIRSWAYDYFTLGDNDYSTNLGHWGAKQLAGGAKVRVTHTNADGSTYVAQNMKIINSADKNSLETYGHEYGHVLKLKHSISKMEDYTTTKNVNNLLGTCGIMARAGYVYGCAHALEPLDRYALEPVVGYTDDATFGPAFSEEVLNACN